MFEIVCPPRSERGIFVYTLREALRKALADEEIWQVADDELRTRVCRIPRQVKPGMRRVGGEWLYSAAWL